MSGAEYAAVLRDLALQSGGLVELYVLGAGYEGWRRAVESLHAEAYELRIVQRESGSPADFGPELFAVPGAADYSLSIQIDNQVWTSTFPTAESIELQGDPRDIISPRDLEQVLRLMRILNSATGKRVILVSETLDPVAVTPYIIIPPNQE